MNYAVAVTFTDQTNLSIRLSIVCVRNCIDEDHATGVAIKQLTEKAKSEGMKPSNFNTAVMKWPY